jgi:hypothetical protein
VRALRLHPDAAGFDGSIATDGLGGMLDFSEALVGGVIVLDDRQAAYLRANLRMTSVFPFTEIDPLAALADGTFGSGTFGSGTFGAPGA